MKKFAKIISILLALALVFVCAGCGNADTNSGAGEEKKETLVMGTNAQFPPYEFRDDNQNIVGIDAEIAAAVAEKLGCELDIKDMDFESLITAVQSGAIDFALAGITVNEERKESVDFSDTYARGVQVIIVPEKSAIASAKDLTGKKIGVQSGTTGDTYCTEEFGQDMVSQYKDGATAIAALLNGQVECVIIDNEPAKNFVKANKGLKILETSYADEYYAAAISKENPELREDFNNALRELKDDGTIDRIINKYIPAE